MFDVQLFRQGSHTVRLKEYESSLHHFFFVYNSLLTGTEFVSVLLSVQRCPNDSDRPHKTRHAHTQAITGMHLGFHY